MRYIFYSFIFIFSLVTSPVAQAQQQASPNEFFRPVQASQLITILPPRTNQNKTLNSNISRENFFSFQGGGCPEVINIGSVDENTETFGNINLDVTIDGSIFIQCGAF